MGNFYTYLVLVITFISTTTAYIVNNNPYHHWVTLDPQGKYQLEWLADWSTHQIYFNVTVQTRGYVGFGLATTGRMPGADMVIGGVHPDGSTYFADRYSIAKQIPEIDPSQDWKLLDAWERGVTTFLSFSRPFETCDNDHDLPITNFQLSSIIWAYGENDDEIQYHFQHRGSYDVYLLDPDLVPRGIEQERSSGLDIGRDVRVHRLTPTIKLREQDTMYWCTFHKLPMSTKQHVIGFNTFFPTEQDRTRVHHLLLHRCRAPAGINPDTFFGPSSRSQGSECNVLDIPNPLPVPYCRDTIHVWAVGGSAIFFPDHVGLPIASSAEDEYLMLQVHYDNPNLSSQNATVSLEMHHTENLRNHEVGVFQLGDMQPGSTTILIPPSDPSHIITGHCAAGCTDKILRDVGPANIFAVFLHTHLAGRGVRARHFRNERELAWIQADDNYNFNFQQFRLLKDEKNLLPGDSLIVQCHYDNTIHNATATVGGLSTREERCTSFMYYYNRSPGFHMCRGEIVTDKFWNFLGIQNVTWNESIKQAQVTGPPPFTGMTVMDYVTNEMQWTIERRRKLQRMQIYEPQLTHCPRFFWEDGGRAQLGGQGKGWGRLPPPPGSNGEAYITVDDNFSFESVYPKGHRQWYPESQCSKKGHGGGGGITGIHENLYWNRYDEKAEKN